MSRFEPREIRARRAAIGEDRVMVSRAVIGVLVVGGLCSSAAAQPGMTPSTTEPPASPVAPPASAPTAPPASNPTAPPASNPTAPPASNPTAPPASDPTAMPAPEPPPAPEMPMVVKLTMGARNAARDGRCDSIAIIGERVRQIDPTYHQQVFLVDPEIRACRQGVSIRPPSSAATLTAPPPPITAGAQEDLMPSEIIEVKSPGTALLLSLGVTLGGLGLSSLAAKFDHGDGTNALGTLGGIAFLVGPTMGHAYAGNTWNTGLKWRLASVGVMTGGLIFAVSQCPPFGPCSQSEHDSADVGLTIVIGGLISLGAATVYEIATAGSSARTFNLEYSRNRLQLAPMAGGSPGLSLAGTF